MPVAKLDLLNKTEHPIIKLDTSASFRNKESLKRLSEIQAANTAKVIAKDILDALILFLDVGS